MLTVGLCCHYRHTMWPTGVLHGLLIVAWPGRVACCMMSGLWLCCHYRHAMWPTGVLHGLLIVAWPGRVACCMMSGLWVLNRMDGLWVESLPQAYPIQVEDNPTCCHHYVFHKEVYQINQTSWLLWLLLHFMQMMGNDPTVFLLDLIWFYHMTSLCKACIFTKMLQKVNYTINYQPVYEWLLL